VLELTLPGGAWKGQWWSPRDGKTVEEIHGVTDAGTIRLPAPAFSEDLLLRLESIRR